jgi:tRNA G10  N-methylase Trm11
MKKRLECNIQLLNDAIVMNYINVVCEFFKSARKMLEEGGIVCIYEDFQPPITYREELTFSSLEEFNKWTKERFSMIDCD